MQVLPAIFYFFSLLLEHLHILLGNRLKEQSVLINSHYRITVAAERYKSRDPIIVDAVPMIALTLQLFWCGNFKARVVLLKSWREFLHSAIP